MQSDKLKIRAKNNAYALLRQRPRSEFEIRRRLELKGYDGPLINGIVENLRRTGDIDDAKFARLWVESRMVSSPVGDVVLRHELKEKGVKDSIIEAALADKARSYDEYEAVFGMAAERFERLKKLDRQKALKRLYDFLIRRGFKYDTVRRTIEALTEKSNVKE